MHDNDSVGKILSALTKMNITKFGENSMFSS